MPIYFDVGANDGSSMIHHAYDPANTVYAFEPTPRMIDVIKSRVGAMKNYILVPKAVSDYSGRAQFHVAGQYDWGCSSLYNFNDNLETTWPGRPDFKVTETIDVDVIRLQEFVVEHDIDEIEYLHVDTQGADLEVLIGLGDKLSIVKAGVIEMPTSHTNKLYKNQKYVVEDARRFLEEHGFEITGMYSNDCYGNEMNISFRRI